MKKKLILFIIITLLFNSNIFSQVLVGRSIPQNLTDRVTSDYYSTDFSENLREVFEEYNKKNSLDDFKNKPLLFSKWDNDLRIIMKSGKIFKVRKSNFHITKQIFITKLDDETVFMWKDNDVDKFVLSGMVFKKINDDFYEIIQDSDNIKLLKKYSINVTNNSGNNPLALDSKKNNKIYIRTKYYLFINGKLNKVKLKKKHFSRLLNNNEKINVFVKENKLKFNKEKDLKQILRYYKTL